MTFSDPNPGFKVTGYLKVEYLADGDGVSFQLYKAQLYITTCCTSCTSTQSTNLGTVNTTGKWSQKPVASIVLISSSECYIKILTNPFTSNTTLVLFSSLNICITYYHWHYCVLSLTLSLTLLIGVCCMYCISCVLSAFNKRKWWWWWWFS